MVLSRTCQYAIQALIYIAAQPPGVPVLNRAVAQYLNVPPSYLAKVMQMLEHGKLLYSFRGRLGGFCLREGCEKTDLLRILILIEGAGLVEDCVLGLKVCSNETACAMHYKWKPIKAKILEILQTQTLEMLSHAVKRGKYRLTDLPNAILSAQTLPVVQHQASS